MNKRELCYFLNDNRDELLNKVKELHRQAFLSCVNVKMHLFVNNDTHEIIIVSADVNNSIDINNYTCIFCSNSSLICDGLDELICSTARMKNSGLWDLDDIELLAKLSYCDYQSIKFEVVEKIMNTWDLNYVVNFIIIQLSEEAQREGGDSDEI